MRRLGFLATRRWIVFLLVVLALAALAWRLGVWQFDRLQERRERNAQIQRNEALNPAPVTDIFAPDRPIASGDQWRIVTATGEYAAEDTLIVRYRTRNDSAGVNVVVPLDLTTGETLLVDRGWMPTENSGATINELAGDVPDPPPGTVTITGWARADATGDSTQVVDSSTRAIASGPIGDALGRDALDGFVELRSEDPAPAEGLMPVDPPELDDGPHFFYGLQWWFFGLLALIGFVWMAVDEARGRPGLARRTPSDSRNAERTDDPAGSAQSRSTQSRN